MRCYVCLDYGNLFVLLDSAFSSLHVARGAIGENSISEHESQVKNVLDKWKQMNFRMTPKIYLILHHSVYVLRLRNGMSHVEESRLERAHQFQSKDKDQRKKVSNKNEALMSKTCK